MTHTPISSEALRTVAKARWYAENTVFRSVSWGSMRERQHALTRSKQAYEAAIAAVDAIEHLPASKQPGDRLKLHEDVRQTWLQLIRLLLARTRSIDARITTLGEVAAIAPERWQEQLADLEDQPDEVVRGALENTHQAIELLAGLVSTRVALDTLRKVRAAAVLKQGKTVAISEASISFRVGGPLEKFAPIAQCVGPILAVVGIALVAWAVATDEDPAVALPASTLATLTGFVGTEIVGGKITELAPKVIETFFLVDLAEEETVAIFVAGAITMGMAILGAGIALGIEELYYALFARRRIPRALRLLVVTPVSSAVESSIIAPITTSV